MRRNCSQTVPGLCPPGPLLVLNVHTTVLMPIICCQRVCYCITASALTIVSVSLALLLPAWHQGEVVAAETDHDTDMRHEVHKISLAMPAPYGPVQGVDNVCPCIADAKGLFNKVIVLPVLGTLDDDS